MRRSIALSDEEFATLRSIAAESGFITVSGTEAGNGSVSGWLGAIAALPKDKQQELIRLVKHGEEKDTGGN
jgi:hypothetical protein